MSTLQVIFLFVIAFAFVALAMNDISEAKNQDPNNPLNEQ